MTKINELIKNNWVFLLAISGALLLGMGLNSLFRPNTSSNKTSQTGIEKSERKAIHWTCSMHPQIKQDGPGKCPICGMDLIPIYGDAGDEGGEVSLKLGKRARVLAAIATSRVDHRPLSKEIYTVGKMDYDEGSLAYVAAWIAGRIDKLYADFTGIKVKKGEHLVLLYSPELMSAQEEYLLALRDWRRIKGQSSQIAAMSRNTLRASREKLLLYGITKKQLKEIEQKGKVQTHLTVYAPISGTVIHKKAFEGMYVKTGEQIYTIADLSHLWLYLDIYEYDLAWIKFGQPVEITTEAYPGQTFKGTITFIDPFLNEKTRTVKVRVNVPNPGGRLKPGMYANARIKVRINKAGQVVVAGLQGKYMCPMHPEIILDKKGKCPICGMALEPVGGVMGEFASQGTEAQRPGLLSIPRSAVLDTGQRKLVYVELAPGKYSPREIKVGPAAGDYYPVLEGLKEGEQVVTSGNFLIDSQMQLAGKPSLMFPEGSAIDIHAAMGHGGGGGPKTPRKNYKKRVSKLQVPPGLVKSLGGLLPPYYGAQKALARDSVDGLADMREQLQEKIPSAAKQAQHLPEAHRKHFKMALSKLEKSLAAWKLKNIENARKGFQNVSKEMISLLQDFYQGQSGADTAYKFYCSMVPAYWLQSGKEAKNPYYGSSMLGCGELLKENNQ